MAQGAIPLEELKKIPYVDSENIGDRFVLLMPLWDGTKWRQWVPTGDGKLQEIKIADTVRANYVAKESAAAGDLFIPFVHLLWQHASWPEIFRLIIGLCDDFHNLGTSAAKLKHFTQAREMIGNSTAACFVETELEYVLILARQVFDLLQETIAILWNGRIQLLDEESEKRRKQYPLQDTFRKLVLRDGKEIKSVEELIERHALPSGMAEAYVQHAPFFIALRDARDRIVHGGTGISTIFVTEKGFCVDPKQGAFAIFDIWNDGHKYNENISSLLPWVSHIVFQTINACTEIMEAFAHQVRFPPEIAPGYGVFVRDEISHALLDLHRIHKGEGAWWDDASGNANADT